MTRARKVLAFARRFHFQRVEALARVFFPGAEIALWSDERTGGRKANWWGPDYYRAYRERAQAGLAEDEVRDMVERCRWLRVLPAEKAQRVANASVVAWSDILRREEPEVVLLLDVDSNPLDGLARAADALGVPNVAPILSTYNGRIRFSQRGELRGEMPAALVEEAELEKILDELAQPGFRPGWLAGTNRSSRTTALRRMAVDSAKPAAYALYRLLAGDPLSFSFCRPDRDTMLIARPASVRAALRTEERAVRPLPEDFALVPLQFYPESTSDYFVPERAMIHHHRVVLTICEALRGTMPVVVKEHPYVFGRRSPRVLESLLAMDHVWFAPLLQPVGELVERSALLVGYHSSTMLQALLRGRRLLFTGTPYYGDAGHPVLTNLEPESVRAAIDAALARGPTDRDAALAVHRRLFRATARASLGHYAPLLESTVSHSGEPSADDACRALLASALAPRTREAQPV